MSRLTENGSWTLQVVVKYYQLYDGSTDPRADSRGVGYWENFRVADETDNFKLTIGRRIKADNMAGSDPWSGHNGCSFSTKNRDNDRSDTNCASTYKSGWWFKHCRYVCLNCEGEFLRTEKRYNWDDEKSRFLSESTMWMKRNE